jgi:hypothetical protein
MFPRIAALLLLVALAPAAHAAPSTIDLTAAVVVAPPDLTGPENKAVVMLLDEVEKRTQVRWERRTAWPTERVPVIAVGTAESLTRLGGRALALNGLGPAGPEGYRIAVDPSGPNPAVRVIGNDSRGVLFGVGKLLRSLEMTRKRVTLPADFRVASAPRYPLRGHQLGYRPKTNSYDGWTVPMWEQYIRDLAVFGCNAVELIPPRSDDAPDSPHFPLPQMDMMVAMSRLLDEYGLDVWIWYPAMDRDYSDPRTVEFALKEWGEVFRKLPRVDAVFVPGGDPGHTRPRHLMALLEKQTANLHRYHPKAQMWVSPQSFTKEWMDEFLDLLKTEPAWLAGIVYGPQVRMPLAELRKAVPARYPIRHYPDITHSLRCEYPVPDWDAAFARTLGREPINPRPRDQATIFRHTHAQTNGFITYSEGCNDDVNKAVWSALGWEPDADVLGVLRDYSRYFLGPNYADSFAHGLLSLEQNWRGPALTNAGITTTLRQFQDLERTASPRDKLNWRFQQALYRAYYDAYVRCRLIHETALEEQALEKLRQARRTGSLVAVSQAEAVLDRAVTEPVAADLRARVAELAEAQFQSIRMQLSVEKYQGMAGRGTNLDTIDTPLNDRVWLKQRFEAIRRTETESERLRMIDEIVHWTDPGPGGFYDDLGNPSAQPHLVRGPDYAFDPDNFIAPLCIFADRSGLKQSWYTQAITFYDGWLQMRYTGLDRSARYTVRVVYGSGPVRLRAGERHELHGPLTKQYQPLEFEVPPDATAGGTLELTWNGTPGTGGPGRGCQVCEVWLLKQR